MHQNRLDDKISHQLPMNGLIDARSMLGTKDRADIILDVEELFAYQEEEDSIMEVSYLTVVDDEDDILQFTDCLRGQHTAE
jgi:hypothetical protein